MHPNETDFLGRAEESLNTPFATFLMSMSEELEPLWDYGLRIKSRLESDGWSPEVAEGQAADVMHSLFHLFMDRVNGEIRAYLDADPEDIEEDDDADQDE